MRGVHSAVDEIRRSVFQSAKLAYEGGDYTRVDPIPIKSCPVRSHTTGMIFSWSGRSSSSGCGWPAACRSSQLVR